MKECPYCGHANEDGDVICRVCHTDLDPPPASPVDPELEDPALALCSVGTFPNVIEANLFQAHLEGAGIEACVPEEYTTQQFWTVMQSPLEPVSVRVAAKDLEEAQAFYANYIERKRPSKATEAAKSAAKPPREEATNEQQSRKPCVACEALIPASAELCPECGWRQPGG